MLTTVTDAGGSINYAYYSSGLTKTVTSPGGLVTSLEFDKLGRRTGITEPNAGTYTFEYNPFGEMIQQNANDSITDLTYDELGRILSLSESEGITSFTYDTKDYGLGKLSRICSPGSVTVDFEYDALGRLTSKTESIDSLEFTEALVYDRFGRDSLLIYPSGYTIKYIYNNNSYLSQIKKASDNTLIWQANSMNAKNQITGSTYGNNLMSQFSYQHGHVTGDLAKLYYVETKVLKQAVRRNIDRFPDDFMFELSSQEFTILRSQIVTSSWGGSRYVPMAFTEQGVEMLSSVLNSDPGHNGKHPNNAGIYQGPGDTDG